MAQRLYCFFWDSHPSTSEFLLVVLNRLRSCYRSCYCGALLLLIGYEPDLIDPQLPDLIDDADYVAVADANATLDVDDTILLILNALEHRIDFVRQLFS